MFKSSGIVVLYVPPYSPYFNPIEEAFSHVKRYLRTHNDILQATGNPTPLIEAAFDIITITHCNKWMQNCGYSLIKCNKMKFNFNLIFERSLSHEYLLILYFEILHTFPLL